MRIFRAAHVEKLESLVAAKAKNVLGGGGAGVPVAHARTVPIWEYLRISSGVTRRVHYLEEVRELIVWQTTVVSTSLIDDNDVTNSFRPDHGYCGNSTENSLCNKENVQECSLGRSQDLYPTIANGYLSREKVEHYQWKLMVTEWTFIGFFKNFQTSLNLKFSWKSYPFSHVCRFRYPNWMNRETQSALKISYPFSHVCRFRYPNWVNRETQSALKKYPFAEFCGRTCLHKKCLSVRHPSLRRKKKSRTVKTVIVEWT